ncbi:MAG: EAL domain-containing protein [Gammaproteobacteria bacterium]|nr:EAL domain-containing protein [Gammaproteobacteria bacterium]
MSAAASNTAAALHRRVLIVDDDRDFADSIADLLALEGYEVCPAYAVREAEAAIEGFPARVALIDVRLGTTDGVDLVARLKAIRPEITCVMMTAYASTDSAIAALKTGAYDYLRKPFHPGELLASLGRAFERMDLEHEKSRAREALRRYEQIISSTADLMAFVDRDHVYQAVNDAFVKAYNTEREAIVGRTMSEIHGPAVFEGMMRDALTSCLEGEETHYQAWFDFPLSGRRFMDVAYYPYRDGEDSGAVVSWRDLTETHTLSEKLTYQATHDALTGLVNRREFEQQLRRLIEVARQDRTEHALCYLDLDQFKLVNDTCGHVAGDELLRQLGLLLPEHVRKDDTLARLGGDEFGVLMEGCSLSQATRVANVLLDSIRGFQFHWEDKTFNLGVSIGVVPINEVSESITAVLSIADAACYAAKDEGRNRIHVFREDDTKLAKRQGEMQWVTRIQRALEEDRFELYVQPIAAVAPAAVSGHHYEVLVRMHDERGHTVLPGAFLSAAERYNLSARLDQWVIRSTFDALVRHPEHLERLYLCSINLSGHSLGDEQLLGYVIEQFRAGNVPSEKICIEITETAAIANLSSATRFIKVLKEWGCRFALDDFGSGLSSFAYLKTLPVDFLKIDGIFVKDVVGDPIDYAMVKSINDIGHVMGKQTVAEFVDDGAILGALGDIGVDYAQGYAIGEPTPITAVVSARALDDATSRP